MNKNTAEAFLFASTYSEMGPSDQQLGKVQPALELPYTGELIDLPDPLSLHLPSLLLNDALRNRKSIRTYGSNQMTIEELSYALYMTQGIKAIQGNRTVRMVPSAGARHAFETFLLVNHVEKLKPGMYRYIASKHGLLEVETDNKIADQIVSAALHQTMVKSAQVTFIWVADVQRMVYRYGLRGYRYLFLDAGHVCQNLYLVAEQLDSGTCAIAAYDDAAMNRLVGVDGKEQFVIYMATLGKKVQQ